MDNERITLRLEAEDLAILDKFVEKYPEYSNRSQLARLAIRAFIDETESSHTVDLTAAQKNNIITVEIPRLAHNTIMDSVRAGVFNSTEEAIVQCVREKFISSESLEAIKKRRVETLGDTVELSR